MFSVSISAITIIIQSYLEILIAYDFFLTVSWKVWKMVFLFSKRLMGWWKTLMENSFWYAGVPGYYIQGTRMLIFGARGYYIQVLISGERGYYIRGKRVLYPGINIRGTRVLYPGINIRGKRVLISGERGYYIQVLISGARGYYIRVLISGERGY